MFPRFARVRHLDGVVRLVERNRLSQAELNILNRSSNGVLVVKPLPDHLKTPTESVGTATTPEIDSVLDKELGKLVKCMKCDSLPSVGNDIAHRGVELANNVRFQLENLKKQLGVFAENTIFANTGKLAAALLGISESTLHRSKRRTPPAQKPAKKRESRKETYETALKILDEEERKIVVKHIEKCHVDEANFTLTSLHEDLENQYGIQLSVSSLFRILKALRFSYKIKSYNPFCSIRSDIAAWRSRYLRQIENLRNSGAFICFYDETWVYHGMGSVRGWNRTDTNPYLVSHMGDLSQPRPGFAAVNNKGQRAIVLAVLTESEILKGSVDVVIAGRPGDDVLVDYHQYMNADMFKAYMLQVVPRIAAAAPPGRKPVLVIDNASIHNSVVEKIPTKTSKKSDITEFLKKYGIDIDDQSTKEEMVEELERFLNLRGGRKRMLKYEFDEFAKTHGVEIVRLPPYHCQFSPIELIWHQLKAYLRSIGKSSDKLEVVRERAIDFLRRISETIIAATYQHVIDIETGIKIAVSAMSDSDSD